MKIKKLEILIAAILLMVALQLVFDIIARQDRVVLKNEIESNKRIMDLNYRRLQSSISTDSKRAAFVQYARDSVIMKLNRGLSESDAFSIAEFTLYTAEKYNVDPILLLAIQARESAFRHDAVSHCGAEGLMQIMPTTANMISSSKGVKYYDLKDPKTSIDFGATLIDMLRTEYNGMTNILIAYNAGPRWIFRYRKNGRLPDETRHYIVAVQSFYDKFSDVLAIHLPVKFKGV